MMSKDFFYPRPRASPKAQAIGGHRAAAVTEGLGLLLDGAHMLSLIVPAGHDALGDLFPVNRAIRRNFRLAGD